MGLSVGNKGGKGRVRTVVNPGFGELIYAIMLTRRKRNRTAWTSVDLARLCDVSETTVRFWLAGTRRPSGDNLERLADVLGLDVGELVRARKRGDISHISTVGDVRVRECKEYSREATRVATAIATKFRKQTK